jgi:hypothetical protein
MSNKGLKLKKHCYRIYYQLKKFGFREIIQKLNWRVQKKIKKIYFDNVIRPSKRDLIAPKKVLRLAFVNDQFLKHPFVYPNELLLKEADRICEGYFEIHDYGVTHCDIEKSDWRSWEAGRIRSFHRHDFLITLTRAIKVNSNKRPIYLGKLNSFLAILPDIYHFDDIYKYDKAVDIAIRILNWTAVCALFSQQDWVENHHRYCYLQVEWMRANLSPGGNHKLLEGLALYAAGQFFPELPNSAIWRHQGQDIVVHEMYRQVAEDGVHKEQSMFYHQVCVTHFMKFFLLSQKANDAIPQAFIDRLRSMLQYVYETQKPDGTHPMIGDGDQLSTEDREHWEAKALIPLYGHFFGQDDGSVYGTDSDAADWFIETDLTAAKSPPSLPSAERESSVFAKGGHIVLRHKDDHYLFFNCGEFGYPPYPHHGHADALSFELCMNGQTIMMDAGGYGYHDDPIRHFVRSTAAHNTVMVDDGDQSDVYGIFGVGRTAQVKINKIDLSSEQDIVVAEHDGYSPIKHIRSIVFLKKSIDSMIISDFVEGEGDHVVKVFFHLAPGIKVHSFNQSYFELMYANNHVANVSFFCPPKSSIQMIDENDPGQPIQSMVARKTGIVEKTSLIRVDYKGSLPAQLVTVIAAKKHKNIAFDPATKHLTIKDTSNTYDIDLDNFCAMQLSDSTSWT